MDDRPETPTSLSLLMRRLEEMEAEIRRLNATLRALSAAMRRRGAL